MATIDSKEIIDKIIKNNGIYEGDSRVYMIVEYTNMYGRKTWGVTWFHESVPARTRYLTQTEFIRNPKIIWHSENQ